MITCKFCGSEAKESESAEFHPLYPQGAFNVVFNARFFRQEGAALLHHGCLSPQATADDKPYWDSETDWWACTMPNRPADEHIHFDLGCQHCAERWLLLADELPPTL